MINNHEVGTEGSYESISQYNHEALNCRRQLDLTFQSRLGDGERPSVSLGPYASMDSVATLQLQ